MRNCWSFTDMRIIKRPQDNPEHPYSYFVPGQAVHSSGEGLCIVTSEGLFNLCDGLRRSTNGLFLLVDAEVTYTVKD